MTGEDTANSIHLLQGNLPRRSSFIPLSRAVLRSRSSSSAPMSISGPRKRSCSMTAPGSCSISRLFWNAETESITRQKDKAGVVHACYSPGPSGWWELEPLIIQVQSQRIEYHPVHIDNSARARHTGIALRVDNHWASRSINRELEGNGLVCYRYEATVSHSTRRGTLFQWHPDSNLGQAGLEVA